MVGINLKPPFNRITIRAWEDGWPSRIREMRVTVRRVLEILATYPDRLELFKDYPDLPEEDLQQALASRRRRLTAQSIYISMPHEAETSPEPIQTHASLFDSSIRASTCGTNTSSGKDRS
jgi:uncharacterized protein (DUF433 family)